MGRPYACPEEKMLTDYNELDLFKNVIPEVAK